MNLPLPKKMLEFLWKEILASFHLEVSELTYDRSVIIHEESYDETEGIDIIQIFMTE